MLSRIVIKKQPGRRWLKYIAALGLLVATLVVAGIALAVHDLDFQLDGNTKVDSPTFIGGVNHQTSDWETFFNDSGTGGTMGKISGVLSTTGLGYTADAFAVDFKTAIGKKGAVVFDTSDDSTFTTGSKDTLDISPGWQCAASNNLLSKNDIMNAYTVAYTNPVADANQFLPDGTTPNPNFGKHHQILYFGLERNSNNGDANVAFWFLQGPASCDSSNGTATWTGHHTDGDVLIVSAFTNGGGVSGITAYRWSGGANGFLNPNPVGNGGDCQGAAGLDAICATTNGSASPGLNAAITTKWLTAAGSSVGHTLQPSEFFEGGIDLTTEGLGDKCFNTFVGDTRSSQSLTATIFDYALGTLGECTVSMTTTPSSTADRILGSTASITDTATVTGHNSSGGTAPSPTGTVTFFLCSQSQLTTADANGVLQPDPAGTCNDSDGAQVGSPVTPLTPGAGGTATAISADAHSLLTTIGKYCFRATFQAAADDPNYPGQTALTSNPTTECFHVTAVATTSTTQKWLPQDSAHVTATGGATVAGFVVFQLFESTDCTGSAVQTFGSDPAARLTVDGSGNVTTNNVTYYLDKNIQISWKATFTSTNSVGSGSAAPCERSDIANLDDDITSP